MYSVSLSKNKKRTMKKNTKEILFLKDLISVLPAEHADDMPEDLEDGI